MDCRKHQALTTVRRPQKCSLYELCWLVDCCRGAHIYNNKDLSIGGGPLIIACAVLEGLLASSCCWDGMDALHACMPSSALHARMPSSAERVEVIIPTSYETQHRLLMSCRITQVRSRTVAHCCMYVSNGNYVCNVCPWVVQDDWGEISVIAYQTQSSGLTF